MNVNVPLRPSLARILAGTNGGRPRNVLADLVIGLVQLLVLFAFFMLSLE
jgi:hypothetical protein